MIIIAFLIHHNFKPLLTKPNDLDQLTICKKSLIILFNECESWLICLFVDDDECRDKMCKIGLQKLELENVFALAI